MQPCKDRTADLSTRHMIFEERHCDDKRKRETEKEIPTGAGMGWPATGCWGLRSAGFILYCWARCIGTADIPCAGIPIADGITAASQHTTHSLIKRTTSTQHAQYFYHIKYQLVLYKIHTSTSIFPYIQMFDKQTEESLTMAHWMANYGVPKNQ